MNRVPPRCLQNEMALSMDDVDDEIDDDQLSDADDDFTSVSLDYLPSKLSTHLMPFQQDGIKFGIKRHGRCLIADEMGLGKTLQALCIAYFYRNEWPLLIIVPSSLRYPWIEEMEKWFPDILPEHINSIESSSDIATISSSSITIVTYGLLRHPSSKLVQEALLNQSFKVVIVDESHYIKNRKAATTKYLVPLLQQAHRKILLTGTPALNRPEELFPQLTSIDPRLFGNWAQYAKRYCDARFKFFGRQRLWVTDGAINLEELQSLLKNSIMIRRLKRDVLTQLPAKQRQKISFRLKESDVKREMDKTLDAVHKLLDFNRQTIAHMLSQDGFGRMQMSKADSAPHLMELYGLLSDLHMKTCSAKLGPVKSYVQMLCENQDLKFIIFAYHRVMLDSICEQLVDDNVTFIRIDGSTVTSDRPHLVKQFQSDRNTRVAVLSIKAAGVGLTLTAASLVIFAELDWTPGTLEQCEDRAHRIGQKDTVQVHYLVASGTLDDWVWSALVKKTSVVTTALNGRKQTLKMQKGSSQQVECLSSADAYVPASESSIDVADIIQQSRLRASGQKTVLHFFSPSQSNKMAACDDSDCRIVEDSSWSSPCSVKKARYVNSCASPSATEKPTIVIKSDLEEAEESSIQTDEVSLRKNCKKLSKTHCNRGKQVNLSGKDCLGALKNLNMKSAKWSCSQCTFLNHPLIDFCEMCSSKKEKSGREEVNCLRKVMLGDGLVGGMEANIADSALFSSEPQLNEGGSLSDQATSNGLELQLTNDGENDCLSQLMNERTSERLQAGYHTSTPTRKTDRPVLMTINDSNLTNKLAVSDSSYAGVTDETANFDLCSDWDLSQDDIGDVSQDSRSSTVAVDCRQSKNLKDMYSEETASYVFSDNRISDNTTRRDLNVSAADDKMEEVSVDGTQMHDSFQFLCSHHTSRIYLYDKYGQPLHMNFNPVDVLMENYDELPEVLVHPCHLRILKRFVREWNSLSVTKRRLIVKSGRLFVSPTIVYEELKSTGKNMMSQQRYTSKADVAVAAISKAQEVGGSIRIIKRARDCSSDTVVSDGTSFSAAEVMERLSGFVQVVDAAGNPLCLQCHSSFNTALVGKSTLEDNPWLTRLCSRQCMQQFWIRGHRDYAAKQVYDSEHGVCQLCGFDARAFLQRMELTKNMEKRLSLIEQSVYKALNPNVKEKMIKHPTPGLFWNVDHIVAVADGGGKCDIDNLRTLCTVCHRDVTARQNKDRAQQKLLVSSAKCRSITSFFQRIRT